MRFAISVFALLLVSTSAFAADDTTLAPSEYTTLGVPALDKPWSSADYSSAAEILVKLPASQLVRLASRSAPVFEKYVDLSGYRICEFPLSELAQHAPECASVMFSLVKMMTRYAGEANAQPSLNDSMMRLDEFVIGLGVRISGMMQQLKPTLDRSAPDYAGRLAGIEMTRNGLLQVCVGSGQMLLERDRYSEGERVRLALLLAEVAPALQRVLTPETYEALMIQLRAVGTTDTNSAIKDALSHIGEAPKPI